VALTYTPENPELGAKAPSFSLPDALSGKTFSLSDFSGASALVVMFICKHCPYVVAVQSRIASLAKEFKPKGVQFVAICSNDAKQYPEDAPHSLKIQANKEGFNFPYLVDESQAVGRAYGAVCTPDFFAYGRGNALGEFSLKYRGRLDDNWKEPEKVKKRELAEALNVILQGQTPATQIPSMGCSIKWKG
jgi:peroxiredoxin